MSFDIQDVELVGTLFSVSKFSSRKSPSTEAKKIDVSQVSYSSEVGSLVCATTCVRSDIVGVVGVMSKYAAKKEGEHLTNPMEKFNSPGLMVT